MHNKSLYQPTLMAYGIAQFMVSQGFNANDSDSVSTFVSNLQQALLNPSAQIQSQVDELPKTLAPTLVTSGSGYISSADGTQVVECPGEVSVVFFEMMQASSNIQDSKKFAVYPGSGYAYYFSSSVGSTLRCSVDGATVTFTADNYSLKTFDAVEFYYTILYRET